MNMKAELVRSLMRWALCLIAKTESIREKLPGPRLSQMQLGRMMYRKDIATALALANDIGFRSDKDLTALIIEIRSGWGEDTRNQSRRRDGYEDAYDISCMFVAELSRFLTEDQHRLLLYASTMTTWKALETAFPDRTWFELRAAYESLAITLHDRHLLTVHNMADFIIRINTKTK